MEMEEFNFRLIHKPGRTNKADALSRNPGFDTEEHDNEDVVVLPEQLFVRAAEALDMEQRVAEDQQNHSR